MTTTLDRVCDFFKIDPTGLAQKQRRMPIDIPNVGRGDLPQLFASLGDCTRGAEIGVERGEYAEIICRRHPGVHLICVDAWQAYTGYRDHVSQGKLDGFFDQTRARLAPYDVEFIRAYSVEAARTIPDRSLDFVYIDANHSLEHVIADISAWRPKVRKGGIVAGHDFCRRSQNGYQCHVVEAVSAYTQAYFVYPWFVLGSKAIVADETRDRPRSWMWVE